MEFLLGWRSEESEVVESKSGEQAKSVQVETLFGFVWSSVSGCVRLDDGLEDVLVGEHYCPVVCCLVARVEPECSGWWRR